jgi:hypothetical protein
MFQNHSSLLKKILVYKFTKGNSNITSFEIDMEASQQGTKFQKLVDKLALAASEELFSELETLKDYHR